MYIVKLLELDICRNLFNQILLGWTVRRTKESLREPSLGGLEKQCALGWFLPAFDTVVFRLLLFSAFPTIKACFDGFVWVQFLSSLKANLRNYKNRTKKLKMYKSLSSPWYFSEACQIGSILVFTVGNGNFWGINNPRSYFDESLDIVISRKRKANGHWLWMGTPTITSPGSVDSLHGLVREERAQTLASTALSFWG